MRYRKKKLLHPLKMKKKYIGRIQSTISKILTRATPGNIFRFLFKNHKLKQEIKYIKNDITPIQYKAKTKMLKPMGLISSKYVTKKQLKNGYLRRAIRKYKQNPENPIVEQKS
jgi:hypothetical protein